MHICYVSNGRRLTKGALRILLSGVIKMQEHVDDSLSPDSGHSTTDTFVHTQQP